MITSLMMDSDKYILLDVLNIQSNMNTSSHPYFSRESQLKLKTKGLAILLNTRSLRLTASVFVKFHKPPLLTRIFSNETDALKWFGRLAP
jgi:hypothetical protein